MVGKCVNWKEQFLTEPLPLARPRAHKHTRTNIHARARAHTDALDALKLASHIAEDMGDEAIHESVLARTGLVQTRLQEYDLALKSFG